jgi:hypothetical protein
MYSTKQQAINKYLEHVEVDSIHKINKVDDVVWVNADKMMAVLREHALLVDTIDTGAIKLPPKIEADWDTNDTKEFDRLLYKILFKERTLH